MYCSNPWQLLFFPSCSWFVQFSSGLTWCAHDGTNTTNVSCSQLAGTSYLSLVRDRGGPVVVSGMCTPLTHAVPHRVVLTGAPPPLPPFLPLFPPFLPLFPLPPSLSLCVWSSLPPFFHSIITTPNPGAQKYLTCTYKRTIPFQHTHTHVHIHHTHTHLYIYMHTDIDTDKPHTHTHSHPHTHTQAHTHRHTNTGTHTHIHTHTHTHTHT